MDYIVAFDVAREGYSAWWTFLPSLVPAAIGAGLSRLALFKSRAALGRAVAGISLLLGATVELGTFAEYIRLRRSLARQSFETVEGLVTDFRRGATDGHPPEEFTVAGRRYVYAPFYVTSSFHQIQAHGGPIRDGLRVRIADVGGKIARLEIVPDDPSAVSSPRPPQAY